MLAGFVDSCHMVRRKVPPDAEIEAGFFNAFALGGGAAGAGWMGKCGDAGGSQGCVYGSDIWAAELSVAAWLESGCGVGIPEFGGALV